MPHRVTYLLQAIRVPFAATRISQRIPANMPPSPIPFLAITQKIVGNTEASSLSTCSGVSPLLAQDIDKLEAYPTFVELYCG